MTILLMPHKLLRFIKGAPAQGLFFVAGVSLELSAFCDIDWGACPLTRHSISGFFCVAPEDFDFMEVEEAGSCVSLLS